MKTVTKPEVRCKTCDHITDWEEVKETCDLCGTILDWDHVKGYPFHIDPLYHTEDGDMDMDGNRKKWVFCSIEHGLEWMATNDNPLKVEEDFISFYVHKNQYEVLKKVAREKIINTAEPKNET